MSPISMSDLWVNPQRRSSGELEEMGGGRSAERARLCHVAPAARAIGSRGERRPSGVTMAGKTAFEVFAWAGADDALERLTEGSVGLVSDRAGNVDKLFVTRFE